MPRGGPREGAGRPKGARDKLALEAAQRHAAEGVMPLDFMLSVMRDEGEDMARRLDAAKAAAQFVHPKLSSVEANVKAQVSHEDALSELE